MPAAQKIGVCNLCEAICGLELTIEDGAVTGVRGNPDDPLSRGHICPKGVAIADIHADPDRLRRPVRRDRATGEWPEIGWDEAIDLVADRTSRPRSTSTAATPSASTSATPTCTASAR